LDLPLTVEDLRAAGGTVGSGAVIVMDETASLWDSVLRVARFFQEESCGQCVPCRVGTQRQLEIVQRLASGHGRPGDVGLLREIGATMTDASICGLGQTASGAVLSALALVSEAPA
jgi:NADH-quinone oxidoreductase subunit F